jgi:hypothetical protein
LSIEQTEEQIEYASKVIEQTKNMLNKMLVRKGNYFFCFCSFCFCLPFFCLFSFPCFCLATMAVMNREVLEAEIKKKAQLDQEEKRKEIIFYSFTELFMYLFHFFIY